jgi:enoyl-CoA hydratase
MTNYKRIIYEPGRVTRIIMNRPERMNAISDIMYKELEDAFDDAAEDDNCQVIVFSGAGRCFSTGHDIILSSEEAFSLADGTLRGEPPAGMSSPAEISEYFRNRPKYYHEHYDWFASALKLKKWRAIPKPTIAMVHGYCIYGGFFSAAAMDLVFASEDALFLAAPGEYDIGAWDFGPRKYKEILFEQRFLSARECFESGFVSRIYPNRDILEKETLAYANRIADLDRPIWLRNIKLSINNTMDIQGFSASVEAADNFFKRSRQEDTVKLKSRQRKGVAEVDRALDNLKVKRDADQKYYGNTYPLFNDKSNSETK